MVNTFQTEDFARAQFSDKHFRVGVGCCFSCCFVLDIPKHAEEFLDRFRAPLYTEDCKLTVRQYIEDKRHSSPAAAGNQVNLIFGKGKKQFESSGDLPVVHKILLYCCALLTLPTQSRPFLWDRFEHCFGSPEIFRYSFLTCFRREVPFWDVSFRVSNWNDFALCLIIPE